MVQYIGERTAANQWKSQMFDKHQDMVLIRGKDRTGEIQYMEYDEDLNRYIVYFAAGEVEYYRLEEIEHLRCPKAKVSKIK